MILGIGCDIVEISRIQHVWLRYGALFLDRVFSLEEQTYALGKSSPAGTLAKRFAAKEAFVKAIGTGIAQGILFKEITVHVDPNGRPQLVVTGCAQQSLLTLAEGLAPRIHLSLSDTDVLAQAYVLIEGGASLRGYLDEC